MAPKRGRDLAKARLYNRQSNVKKSLLKTAAYINADPDELERILEEKKVEAEKKWCEKGGIPESDNEEEENKEDEEMEEGGFDENTAITGASGGDEEVVDPKDEAFVALAREVLAVARENTKAAKDNERLAEWMADLALQMRNDARAEARAREG